MIPESIFTQQDASLILDMISLCHIDLEKNKGIEVNLDSSICDIIKRISDAHPILESRCNLILDEENKKNMISPELMDIL